jgi:hypothetical protein
MPLAANHTIIFDNISCRAQVPNTEEKGSDVNLASHLLADACRDAFEAAAIISTARSNPMKLSFMGLV